MPLPHTAKSNKVACKKLKANCSSKFILHVYGWQWLKKMYITKDDDDDDNDDNCQILPSPTLTSTKMRA